MNDAECCTETGQNSAPCQSPITSHTPPGESRGRKLIGYLDPAQAGDTRRCAETLFKAVHDAMQAAVKETGSQHGGMGDKD